MFRFGKGVPVSLTNTSRPEGFLARSLEGNGASDEIIWKRQFKTNEPIKDILKPLCCRIRQVSKFDLFGESIREIYIF